MRRRDCSRASPPARFASALPALAAPVLRRARPGDPGWPSGSGVAGPRRGGRRPADQAGLRDRPCEWRPGAPAISCARTWASLLHRRPAGGTQVSGWLDAWSPSSAPMRWRRAPPPTSSRAVNFARRHNLRPGGQGRRSQLPGRLQRPGFLLVWTRAMTPSPSRRLAPAGAANPPVHAVHHRGGAMWADAIRGDPPRPGASSRAAAAPTVGVAGWSSAGGFRFISKQYGWPPPACWRRRSLPPMARAHCQRRPTTRTSSGRKGGGQCAFGRGHAGDPGHPRARPHRRRCDGVIRASSDEPSAGRCGLRRSVCRAAVQRPWVRAAASAQSL